MNDEQYPCPVYYPLKTVVAAIVSAVTFTAVLIAAFYGIIESKVPSPEVKVRLTALEESLKEIKADLKEIRKDIKP